MKIRPAIPLCSTARWMALACALLACGPLEAQPLITGVAGSGPTTSGAFEGDGGLARAARLRGPVAVAVNGLGDVYFCDRFNHRVRRVDAGTGRITTFAGSGATGPDTTAEFTTEGGFSGDGGPAVEARLDNPGGVAVDGHGNVFISDTHNNRIRRVDAVTGVITSVAGSGPVTQGSFAGDGGLASAARLLLPRGIVVDPSGNLLFCDSGNHRIRRIDAATGLIETVAGRGLTGESRGDFGGDEGPALLARFSLPFALALDARGDLYVADTLNNRVRRIDAASGLVSTVAGDGGALRSLTDGPATETSIGPPQGLAVDRSGALYIATGSGIVYSVAAHSGILSGIAGKILPGGELCSGAAGDGDRAVGACLGGVRGLALDGKENLLLCDATAHRVRRILLSAPVVTRIQPDTISTTGSAVIVFSGSGLSPVTTITGANLLVGGATVGPLAALDIQSESQISAEVPAGAVIGLYNLVLRVPEGGNTALVGSRLLRVQRPSATNGPPLAIVLGPLVLPYEVPFRLDGSASLDLDAGDTISYRWSLATTVPGVAPLESTSPAIETVVNHRGQYQFTLTLTDTHGATATKVVTVVAPDVAPRAVIKSASIRTFILPDDRGRLPASLTTDTTLLDGRASRSLDGDPLTYRWVLVSKPASSKASDSSILDSGAPLTRFRLGSSRGSDGRLDDAGLYRLRLFVSDPAGKSTSALIQVDALSAEDLVPAADAGTQRNVEVTVVSKEPLELAANVPDPLLPPPQNSSKFVRLDGRRSVDPNLPPLPLTYAWTLLGSPAGSKVTTLAGADSASPSFVPDQPGVYRAGLVVSNPFFSSERREVGIAVNVAGGGTVPVAAIVARNRLGPLGSAAAGGISTCIAGSEPVILDAGTSTSADPQGRPRLSYKWSQTAGPPVALSPSATAPAVAFPPVVPGLYGLRLVVTDGLGVTAAPVEARVRALPAATPILSLALVSSASTTQATGADLPGDVVAGPSSSLRVLRPTLVTVLARVSGLTRTPAGRLSFAWRQVSGPTVALSVSGGPASTETSSSVQFAPTTAGVHLLECRAVEIGPSGEPTGRDDVRRLSVVVESAGVTVPVARPHAAAGKQSFGAGETVVLDGLQSVDTGGRPVVYRWTQIEGAPVVLSDPFSPVTSFVVPDFGDDVTRSYVFALFLENGVVRSEPAAVGIQTRPSPRSSCELNLSMPDKLGLMGVPSDPSTTGAPFDAAALAGRVGASFLARTRQVPGERNRFEVYLPGLRPNPFVIEGNQAYLVARPRRQPPVVLPGLTWPSGSRTLRLGPGLNLVAYPGGRPSGETAETLRDRAGAAFVVRSVQGRFQLYLPGLSDPFGIEAGGGYLLSVPRARTVELPPGDCR